MRTSPSTTTAGWFVGTVTIANGGSVTIPGLPAGSTVHGPGAAARGVPADARLRLGHPDLVAGADRRDHPGNGTATLTVTNPTIPIFGQVQVTKQITGATAGCDRRRPVHRHGRPARRPPAPVHAHGRRRRHRVDTGHPRRHDLHRHRGTPDRRSGRPVVRVGRDTGRPGRDDLVVRPGRRRHHDQHGRSGCAGRCRSPRRRSAGRRRRPGPDVRHRLPAASTATTRRCGTRLPAGRGETATSPTCSSARRAPSPRTRPRSRRRPAPTTRPGCGCRPTYDPPRTSS